MVLLYKNLNPELICESGVAFDHLEAALQKFDDGPFFLGQFSMASHFSSVFVGLWLVWFGFTF